jgi:hypothetical protein
VRIGRLRDLAVGTLVAGGAVAVCPTAHADKIGGSNLPQAAPSLKGRITEDGATEAWVFGTGIGATTNAGPTLLESPSAFAEQSLAYARILSTAFGRMDIAANLQNRTYTSFRDADELTGAASIALNRDWGTARTVATLAFSSGRDVEERLNDASLVVEHTATSGSTRPYVRAEAAYLDFMDMPGEPGPFQNADDRDRLSARVQAGVRYTISREITLEAGAGLDTKRYRRSTDDFGVDRDSSSAFSLAGFSYASERATFRAIYSPFLRMYRETLFEDTWKHGYRIEGEWKLNGEWKAFAATRYGFEETDFLIASSAYERVVLAGLTVTLANKATASLAASRSWRAYDGLHLLGIGRADEKTEIAFSMEWPLTETLALSGKLNYLDFESSFGPVGTDGLTAVLGVSYAITR